MVGPPSDTAPTDANLITIRTSRVRYGALAAALGVFLVAGTARSLTTGSVFGVVFSLGLFGSLFAFSIHRALMRRPLIMIDDHGFTDGRSGRNIPWDAVEEIFANAHQGGYGVDHSLRLVLKRRPDQPVQRRFITTNATNEDEVEVDLDMLAMPREHIIRAVESRFGRPALRTADAGLQNLRRRSR